MWVDKGREFYNKHVKKLVELYSTENEEKSYVIERFNRTIKEKMFKYFSANNTNKCVGVLDLLVDQYYNAIHSSIKILVFILDLLVDQYYNAIHSSIKMTPKEASLEENEIKCG